MQPIRKLPVNCTGCGAFSQSHDPKQFGYYNVETKRVQKWLYADQYEVDVPADQDDQIVNQALKSLDSSQLEALGLDPATLLSGELPGQEDKKAPPAIIEEKPPVCERCHGLIHHGATSDIPMFHPTVDSLRETIEESPHKYNHIYHVIDAADFPMSLIPRLNVLLGDIPLRSRNRRSRAHKFMRDRQVEMSFIITRGDLLGPTKEIVDSMMPYLRQVMRDALGRLGNRIRLGNLRCVSAKRGWWTQEIREDIWKRGGAGWMVGKVNVGKSQLFEAVYPKGRLVTAKPKRDHVVSMYPREEPESSSAEPGKEADGNYPDEPELGDLLPPLQPETQYPAMPMVSALPGTTASPIRIPFGNKKGELIDLPGLERSDLELFVKPEHRKSLIMKHRVIPEQVSVAASTSLLLGGGLIRITPRTSNLTFLMYNFTPLKEHLTKTEKAIEFQNQTRVSPGVENIVLDGIGDKMQLAGTFKLCHDVTKRRAGPLTRKDAVGLSLERLPFRVLSIDILIEGVGYVEIVAQVRTRDLERSSAPGYPERAIPPPAVEEIEEEPEPIQDPFAAMMTQRRGPKEDAKRKAPAPAPAPPKKKEPEPKPGPEPLWPEIDVFTPEGRFVDSRRPIEGWMNNKPRVRPEHKRSRPRRSMKGAKKREKAERRSAGAAW